MNKFRSSASEKGKGCIVIFLQLSICTYMYTAFTIHLDSVCILKNTANMNANNEMKMKRWKTEHTNERTKDEWEEGKKITANWCISSLNIIREYESKRSTVHKWQTTKRAISSTLTTHAHNCKAITSSIQKQRLPQFLHKKMKMPLRWGNVMKGAKQKKTKRRLLL